MTGIPRAVILGATGFLGKALAERLAEGPEVEVNGRNSRDLDLVLPASVEELGHLLDRNTILFIAARSSRQEDQFASCLDDFAISTNVARALSKFPVKKCVYFGSLEVYGTAVTNLAITEGSSTTPMRAGLQTSPGHMAFNFARWPA